jgi:hypothetical protein
VLSAKQFQKASHASWLIVNPRKVMRQLSRFNPLAAQMLLHRVDGHFLPVKNSRRQGRLGSGFFENIGRAKGNVPENKEDVFAVMTQALPSHKSSSKSSLCLKMPWVEQEAD